MLEGPFHGCHFFKRFVGVYVSMSIAMQNRRKRGEKYVENLYNFNKIKKGNKNNMVP